MAGFLKSLFSRTTPLQVGDPAPAGAALNEKGESVELVDVYRAGTTLVYFYPKSDTPGCTAQACSLRDFYDDLNEKGVRVVGVSTDRVEALERFKSRYRLPFMLLSDKDKRLAMAFGVPVNLGFTSRQAFLIRDGRIVWLDRSASTSRQAEDVLQALR